MPIYEYKCRKCGEKFDAYRPLSASDGMVKCPKCGEKNPERVFSVYMPRISGSGSCLPISSRMGT
jgi:putative FmdB family regulatory protein